MTTTEKTVTREAVLRWMFKLEQQGYWFRLEPDGVLLKRGRRLPASEQARFFGAYGDIVQDVLRATPGAVM